MAKDLFSSLDLNLLRTFLVVYQEKNTRKTAERLFVSQPAISQALQKLRHHFDDELFVKVHGGLQPTSFCTELANTITPYFHGLESALNKSNQFKPSDIDHKIRLALSPVVLTCLSGSLYKRIKAQAPNAQLELLSWKPSTQEDIQKGTVDLGVSYVIPNSTKEVYAKKLIDVTGRIFVREGHPIKKSVIEPLDMAGFEIASMISPGWNDNFSYASQILDRYSIEHKVGFRSELIMAIIDVVLHTDMYMPHSNIFPVENYSGLRAVDVLIEGELYKTPIHAHFHVKNRNNPMITWLFSEIQEALTEQADKHNLSQI
ncbi:LysR family transcriptional regulator [Vibrio makurazakiensis]|uniref:LysR family transcriptional regulator n=1 Tax=Vibrio makurazakiensis TaxID=2910250 RepID=UPI003D150E04